MDSDSWAGVALLALAVIAFMFVVAAEAVVIAGLRSRAQGEAPASRADARPSGRMEALQRFALERQATLAALALARNLALIAITAIVVALVLEATGHNWGYVALSAIAVLAGLMLLQALPRLVVSRNPERWSSALRPFIAAIRLAFGLPARLLDIPMLAIVGWWRRRRPETAPEVEDLAHLAALEQAGLDIDEAERQMIRGVMELEETTVREVMVPRTDIVAVEADDGFQAVSQMMAETGYSRLPVFKDTMDNILGVVYAKEVLRHLARQTAPQSVAELARPAYFVPESKKVDDLLTEMRQQRLSIAIVVDEYGGTAGLATIEDLVEEIVGEIEDEFDVREEEVQLVTPTEAIVDARVGVDSLNDMFDLRIEKEDFDSVGGFIAHSLGRMPSVGDEVRVDGLVMRVLTVMGRRVKKVRVTKVDREAEEARGESRSA